MVDMPKAKYEIRDFRGLTAQERSLHVLVTIANELHNIYSLIWEMKEKK